MSKVLTVIAAGIVLGLASACNDLTVPVDNLLVDIGLPPPDTSLDPDRLVVGDYIATPCGNYYGGFDHLLEQHEWAFVDVYFGRGSAEGPWGPPTAADIELVTAHGGSVGYAFNIPAVRARMMLSRIPGLIREDGQWIKVREVPDASRYDVPLSVGFTRPFTDADVDLFVSLGGRVEYRWDFINALHGVLPDRSNPAFQNRPDVEYVQAEGVACVA